MPRYVTRQPPPELLQALRTGLPGRLLAKCRDTCPPNNTLVDLEGLDVTVVDIERNAELLQELVNRFGVRVPTKSDLREAIWHLDLDYDCQLSKSTRKGDRFTWADGEADKLRAMWVFVRDRVRRPQRPRSDVMRKLQSAATATFLSSPGRAASPQAPLASGESWTSSGDPPAPVLAAEAACASPGERTVPALAGEAVESWASPGDHTEPALAGVAVQSGALPGVGTPPAVQSWALPGVRTAPVTRALAREASTVSVVSSVAEPPVSADQKPSIPVAVDQKPNGIPPPDEPVALQASLELAMTEAVHGEPLEPTAQWALSKAKRDRNKNKDKDPDEEKVCNEKKVKESVVKKVCKKPAAKTTHKKLRQPAKKRKRAQRDAVDVHTDDEQPDDVDALVVAAQSVPDVMWKVAMQHPGNFGQLPASAKPLPGSITGADSYTITKADHRSKVCVLVRARSFYVEHAPAANVHPPRTLNRLGGCHVPWGVDTPGAWQQALAVAGWL